MFLSLLLLAAPLTPAAVPDPPPVGAADPPPVALAAPAPASVVILPGRWVLGPDGLWRFVPAVPSPPHPIGRTPHPDDYWFRTQSAAQPLGVRPVSPFVRPAPSVGAGITLATTAQIAGRVNTLSPGVVPAVVTHTLAPAARRLGITSGCSSGG